MKFIKSGALGLAALLLGWSLTVQAEDIDIYVDNAATGGVPNVLFVFDNGANFSASATNSCTYAGTSSEVPSLGNTAGGIEQCALYNAIYGLQEGTVNVGLMVYNANNIRDWDNANCGGQDGGCLAVPLSAMTPALKAKFLAWIKTWKTTGGAGDGYIKASGDAAGASMQEAWAYYAGRTGISGRNYAGIRPSEGCQNNYVIYVGNAFNNSGTGGDTGNASISDALSSAVPAPTAAQLATITVPSGTYGSKAFSCGSYTMPPHNNSSGLWADEWSRYMYQSDLSSTFDDLQSITTYTIGLLGAACKPDYPALLTSMANVGGGKYFATTDYTELQTAINAILNEVQAVNSVFSSASLPVSVNAQGTFNNQIFLGMFRPNATAAPRWVGNLKQYQFILEYPDPTKPDPNTATLKLGDKLGNSAISSAGTGFITPDAVSFWTSKDTSTAPDSTGGFFVNDKKGSGGAFDLADGEYVEKGGAAQVARLRNLSNNYSTDLTGPRKVYTYCPSGASCQAALTDTSNQFATSNADITADKLAATTPLLVSSITRADSVATVTSTAHGLSAGDSVVISGAAQSEYNGVKTVLGSPAPTANTFAYTVSVSPPTPALGTYTASVPSAAQAIGSIVRSGNTATVTLNNHGYTQGQVLTIAGANQGAYNRTVSEGITYVDANTFRYAVTETPPTSAGSGTATVGATSRTIATTGVSRTAGSLRVRISTTVAHGFAVNNTVTLAGIVDSNGAAIAEYTGSFLVKDVQSSGNPSTRVWFEIDIAATAPASPATGTLTADAGTVPVPVTLTRSGTTATATAVAAHGFNNNQTVNIGGSVGTNESAYAGSFTISTSGPTSTTFTYTVATSPASPATGSLSASKAGASDRDALINWVRGQDNYGDEAGPGSTYTVRPSIHGDVLHSRPVVLNYGDDRGTVVFYGANDGVYRAINGSQSDAIGTVPPGGELWSLVLPEHYSKLARQRLNTPEIRFPNTALATARAKDYFVDGATGVYQRLKVDPADATGKKLISDTAYIFLTMRRGGRLMYALDVSTPTAPTVKWRISNATAGFAELGQTWSRPRITAINAATDPVLIFGAGYAGGYDSSGNAVEEDAEPPTANTMGRGIFVVNPDTGARIWSAVQDCAGATNCLSVPGMLWSIPSDISFVDRNNDGKTDRLYAPDTGGNIWRVDINSSDTSTWTVTKIAALGCATGVCGSGIAPRKFFFPPSVVFVGATGATGSFDALVIGSGDREHPLTSTNPQAAHNVPNRLYMIKDTATGMVGTSIASGSPTLPITEASLDPITTTFYVRDVSDGGFYIALAAGEKTVNAPATVSGTTYLGTNQPTPPSPNTCSSNLGRAKGYAVNPFNAAYSSVVYDGGGLPPSPTTGNVNIVYKDQNNQDKTVIKQICIGCGGGAPVEGGQELGGSGGGGGGGGGGGAVETCRSALENCPNPLSVPRKPRRTYWFRN